MSQKINDRKEGLAYARNRGAVLNTSTGESANLVEWSKGETCKVFTGWTRIGSISLPDFARWSKADTTKDL